MTRDTQFRISRRKVLAGLGTIGIASAGAGLGTTAYFSDEETFTDNRLQAGEFDLKVDWQVTYEGPDRSPAYGDAGRPYVNAYPDNYVNDLTNGGLLTDTWGSYVDGADGVRDPIRSRERIRDEWQGTPTDEQVERAFVSQFADVDYYFENTELPAIVRLDDVKPGDAGEVCFSLHLFDNPGYVWLTGELLENAENGMTEPEAEDPDETSDDTGDDVGELADEIRVELVYTDPDDVYESFTESVFYTGTLREAMAALLLGVPLDGDPTTDGRDCYDPATTNYVCLRWSLPVDHANEVQSDSVAFDVGFYAEQCRHNDGSLVPGSDATFVSPANPDATGTSGNDPDFEVPEGVMDIAVAYGTTQAVFGVDLAEPWSDETEPAANMALGFDMNENGIWDFQVAWSSADGFRYMDTNDDPSSPAMNAWEPLPAGIAAAKSGTAFTFAFDRNLFPASGDTYSFVANASYGGSTHVNVSSDPTKSWSADDGWTSSEYFLQTTV
jgi:predicted ribosomally synthesized peptide with SipW-like signal peptide